MITVKYGSKSFEVKKNKIYTPDGIEISESLSTEEVEVSGKKPTLKIKGIGLQGISMSVKLDCRFVNVETELRYWKNILHGKKSDLLTVGAYVVGKMYLTSYRMADFVLAKDGSYISATLELSFTEDGKYANTTKINFSNPKSLAVKKSSTTKGTIKVGSIIKPRSGARWYYTAEGALKRTGKSGKAYQKNMTVTHIYKKNGKVVCCNPSGLGWLKVEDVILVSGGSTSKVTVSKTQNKNSTKVNVRVTLENKKSIADKLFPLNSTAEKYKNQKNVLSNEFRIKTYGGIESRDRLGFIKAKDKKNMIKKEPEPFTGGGRGPGGGKF